MFNSLLSLWLLVAPLVVLANNATYEVTFSWYGEGDYTGQPNCNSNTVACGFYTYVSCSPENHTIFALIV